ncbi:MAG: HYR domain-containing protein, partial [Flavobacterium sp.]|uniref:HYR domain-containing protein n=1 Tax=Flavobacterium sp. TaxID=239 RepID=UPI002622FE39
TSTQTVTVIDAQNPTIVTLVPISVNADEAVCTYASSQLTAPAAADNCSVATVVATPASLDLGDNTVTWTVTDGSGNTATSTQIVTVIDIQNPTIAILDPISVNADADVCTYASSQLTAPAAADNCSVATVVATPVSLDLGENTVTWTVTDGSGNIETSLQTVTVIDAQNPTIVTLDPISVNADANVCTYASVQLTAPAAADNCSVATVVATPASLDLGENTVTWTVTDGSGNTETSLQTVTVIDTQNPTIAISDVVVSANASCNATGVDLGTPTTTDNCSVSGTSNDAPATFPLGDTTVTWTVTDGSGNTATTAQTVTVEDTTLPTITAPAAVTGNVNASCGATGVTLGNAITADNCSVASVTNDAPAIFPLGETTVTWIVTDGSGNTATATQLVTMGDTIFPVVKAKNATVYLNSVGQAIILPSMIDDGTTDNCEFTLTVSPNNLVCANIGQNNVLLIATDASGNQSFKPATVTLVDNLAPSITAPSNVSVTANASCGATGVTLGFPITSDNCYIDTPAVNDAPATFPIGITTVTWTATDRNGNSATATQTVTVTDITVPTVITKDITIQLDSSGNATLTAAEIDNGSSDNCGISTMTLSQDTFTISDIGIKTITLTVTDNSGNTASATAQVTIDGSLNTIDPKSNLFVIYPIPFDSYINITLPDSYTEDAIYIQVFDLNGREVYSKKHTVDGNNVTIGDLNRYSDGSYYIHLLDVNQKVIQTKHILKKAKQ